MKSTAIIKKQLISSPFTVGVVGLFCWFYWKSSINEQYGIDEWAIYFGLALVTWEPVATWLREGARWVPAAELFFLLHLQFYVAPFVNAKEDVLTISPEIRLKTGFIIIVYLVFCRFIYSLFRIFASRTGISLIDVLNRDLDFGPRKMVVWGGLVSWTIFNIGLQQGWLPNLGANFNLVRTMFSSAGTLSIFILFYEMGASRLSRNENYLLLTLTVLCLTWSISSGFLLYATLQASVALVGYSISRKKVPILAMLFSVSILAFLHIGKAEMRAQYWEQGRNYSTQEKSIWDVYEFWVAASWDRLTDPDVSERKVPSIFDRGSLLQYLSRVVEETPDVRPHINGRTYIESFSGFVPRFIWPDKPSANAANDYLSIYYEFLTEEGSQTTSVATGAISEAWANWGWVGIGLIGMTMGLILCIPSGLSINSSPLHMRFLLSIPFIPFAINLELILGHGLQSLLQGLFASFICLFLISKSSKSPRPAARGNAIRPAPGPGPQAKEAFFIK